MSTYKEFYRRYGTRFVRDLVDPIVWSSDLIEFPKQTILIWLSGTMVSEFPTREYGYFKNLHKPYVYTVLEYPDNASAGNPKHKTINASKIIRTSKLKEPSFKYIKTSKQVSVPSSSPVLFNLGAVNAGYRYSAHPLSTYHVWHNSLSTAVSLASIKRSGANRQKYIFINLPNIIPDRAIINKCIGEPTRSTLKHFSDYTYLNALELFRFISKEHKQHSILASRLSEDEFKYVNLVLSINNKLTIINLGVLASITDAYEITSVLKKYSSLTINKLLYVFLNNILTAAPLLSIQEATTDHLSGISDVNMSDADLEEISLDDVIENELTSTKDTDIDETTDAELIESELNNIVAGSDIADSDTNTTVDITTDTPLTDTSHIVNTVDLLVRDKVISKTVGKGLTETLAEQSTAKSPYLDGRTLADMLTYTDEEVTVDPNDISITDTVSNLDKSSNRDPLAVLHNQYREKTMKKDILSTLYSIQKTGVIIKDHQITTKSSVLGNTEEHKLSLQTVTGDKSTIRIILPVVNEDNTIRLSGSNYVMRTQKADVPIKKISNSIVSISSYYGKLFISKAHFKKNDLGFWFHKQLLNMYEVDKALKDIAAVSVIVPEVTTPQHYGMVGRYIKSFKYKGLSFSFDYSKRAALLKDVDLTTIEKQSVLVGVKKGIPVVMGFDNQLQLLDKDNTKLGTIFEYLNMDTKKAPIEYCNARIYKKHIPLAVILSYYLGYQELFKILKIKYSIIDTGVRTKLTNDQYKITFNDKTIIVDRDYGAGDIVISGFIGLAKYTKRVPLRVIETKSKYMALFTAMELPILYINEIKLMENMFIDPITKQVLGLYKYPTTFQGVLLKAADLLLDDNYEHPNAISGVIFKGYERISGMLYLELVKALRVNNNKSHFSKSKVNINPYSIINRINDDSTTVLVDDINPIASLKQLEDVTYLGSHGRNELTMSEATRPMHVSEIGVISEGVKDCGAVGISAYLSADPKIVTTRGGVGTLNKNDGWASKLSTSAMLAPFGTHDDTKRLNMANIQNTHVIPMLSMSVPHVLTGYESVLAVKASDKFVISAVEAGVVHSADKNSITVIYAESGKKKYTLREWTTKEEAGVTYTHKLTTTLKKGVKFDKDATLAYDKSFFAPDMFDPTRVIYRSGRSLTVALMEAPETYEDSGVISSKTAKLMGTVVTKVKSITLTSTDNIVDAVPVGTKVEPKTPLLSIVDTALSGLSDLDDKAIEILKGLKMLSPKAGYRGTISKIRIFYNCEFNELSAALQEHVKISDALLIDETGRTGQVDSSYSIQGVQLTLGSVEIKYYIKINIGMGTGDKAILGNQLKFTVGYVYDTPIVAEDGSEIDGIFSAMSIEARIVNSPGLMGTTSKVLEVLSDNAVEMYFK